MTGPDLSWVIKITSLLSMYPEETTIQKDTCTSEFITTLFTIARTWKQPKHPSTEEWIKHGYACMLSRLNIRLMFVSDSATLWTVGYQAPLSLGFSRQEHWSGLPFPSPMHESEK